MERKILPQNLKEVLLVSRYITLYLVDSKPPNYFQFMDPLNNFFKVCIDSKISCSCLPGNNDHCMHTFYVLMKIYQISQNDPLIYQSSYTKQQLDQIFSGEHTRVWNKGHQKQTQGKEEKKEQKEYMQKQQIKTTMKQQEKVQKKESNRIQTIKKQNKISQPQKIIKKQPLNVLPKEKLLTYEQPKIEKGSVCSICYQALDNQKPLLKCPSQCFNYFHIKCMKFWVDYQKRQEFAPSCPMCRAKFPQNINQILKKSQNDYIKHYQSFQVNCNQCNQQIKLKLFRCLLCKQCNICQDCYFGWKHLNHDRYVMKKSKKMDWSYAEIRTQASMAKLDISLKYVKQFKNQQQMKMVFGQNYSKFLQANLKKQTLLEYIINSITSVSKQIYKTYKKLDYQQKDIKCMLCKKGKVTQMRRLNCKHFIDQKCLTFLLLNGERICPYDKQPFLESFYSLKLTINKK